MTLRPALLTFTALVLLSGSFGCDAGESSTSGNGGGTGGSGTGGSSAATGAQSGLGGEPGGDVQGECDPSGSTAMVSLTYDDTLPSQLVNAVPALDAHKLTVYLSLNFLSEQSLAVGSPLKLKLLPERIKVF